MPPKSKVDLYAAIRRDRCGERVLYPSGHGRVRRRERCSTLGAAVAAAIAASMGSGILECNRTGGTVKQIHTGWAAHSGIAAAQLAAS